MVVNRRSEASKGSVDPDLLSTWPSLPKPFSDSVSAGSPAWAMCTDILVLCDLVAPHTELRHALVPESKWWHCPTFHDVHEEGTLDGVALLSSVHIHNWCPESLCD